MEQTDGTGEMVLQRCQQLVVHCDAVSDEVLTCTNQGTKRPCCITVRAHDRPAVRIGAQRISQDEGIEPVVLVARRSVSGPQ